MNWGSQWTVAASHELSEMAIDPWINLAAIVENADDHTMRIWFYEVCDPCEADKFGYKIDGVLVSDFITPQWFEPGAINYRNVKFDFKGYIRQPFEILEGGYGQVYDVGKENRWQQITARKPALSDLHLLQSRERGESKRTLVISAMESNFYDYKMRRRKQKGQKKNPTSYVVEESIQKSFEAKIKPHNNGEFIALVVCVRVVIYNFLLFSIIFGMFILYPRMILQVYR